MAENPIARPRRRPIVDAHVHLFDSTANVHAFLDQVDDTFEALVGDYAALPRCYPLEAYLAESRSCDVQGLIWHEYLSDDGIKEARWGQAQANASSVPQAMVALVDFLDPRLEQRLEIFESLPNVAAVREHLGWDFGNPRKRFAKRPDLLTDPAWRRGLASLRRHGFKCGLEVFAPQLPDLIDVVRQHPDLGFTIAVMAWPLDLGPEGFDQWKKHIATLSQCDNVCAQISGIECVFGMNWTIAQARPWILTLIDHFGSNRIMFGSHMPIAGLSVGFERLYDAYGEIVAGFSPDEQDQMFRTTAADWFRLR
jgi:predicted TIM-barrel fold metal-dependent hydrolase